MSENMPENLKTLKEFEDKVHELRMNKLLQYEHVVEEMKKMDEEIKTIMKELESAQKELLKCVGKEEITRYKTVVSLITAKIKLVDSRKNLFAQLRLLCRNIQHEINMVIALKYKAEAEEE